MFVLLGATLPWTVWGELGWTAIALALAVLLLRRLPVLLLLKRPLKLGWPDALYLGVVRAGRCLGRVLPDARGGRARSL